MLGQDIQRDLVGNTDRICDFEPSPRLGQVANYAMNAGTFELNRSGFKNALSLCGTSIIHSRSNRLEI
jgi:hypothetical protein